MCCSGRRYLYGRRAHMTDDQRFASRRTDVLVYESDVLSEDVTLLGPFTASLNVSTSGTDSDFIVKLIDVYSGDFPNPEPNPKPTLKPNTKTKAKDQTPTPNKQNPTPAPKPKTEAKRTRKAKTGLG